MSNLDKLVAKGAYSCGGELLFKNKVMGSLRNGEFHISEAGLAELQVDDVEVKEVKPRGRKAKVVEATPEPEVAEVAHEPSIDDELQDLLGE